MTTNDALELGPRGPLRGTLSVPGDKSMSHRALLFGAIATGESRVRGLAPGADVRSTRSALEALGVPICDSVDAVVVTGRGFAALDRAHDAPPLELDCGNSGTTSRLLLGLLAARRGRFRLSGDASLSKRPMGRVTRPLRTMGAWFDGDDTLPLEIHGAPLGAANLQTEVASAQVKSALILAALQATGSTTVGEPALSRDHTERLLAAMGAPIAVAGTRIRIEGGCAALRPLVWTIPGDPSSAAFAVGLACAQPGSTLTVDGVGLNPRRLGFFRVLQRMGADVKWHATAEAPEPVGRFEATGGALRGVTLRPDEVVDCIDEVPLLAVLCAVATGPSVLEGLGELRVKESDRVAEIARTLRAFGAVVEERGDTLHLRGGARLRGAVVDAAADHRIAMSATVAAALATGPSHLSGHAWVRISYPGFFEDLDRLAHTG